MSVLPEQLRAALLDRVRAFESVVQAEISQLGSTGPGLPHALKVFLHYARRLQDQVAFAWDDSPTLDIRITNLRLWNDHLRTRMLFFDDQFRRGRRGVPHALTTLLERESQRMGMSPVEAVVTLGRPANFGSYVADLVSTIFGSFQVAIELPEDLKNKRLMLISVAEAEGVRAAWQPIICGHELAHFLQAEKPFTLTKSPSLDRAKLAAMNDPIPLTNGSRTVTIGRALEQISGRWVKELICDAYAIQRFGAGGLAALSDFLSFASPESVEGATHPPRAFRTKLMFRWLHANGASDPLGIAEPMRGLAEEGNLPDWALYLCARIEEIADQLWLDVETWCGTESYQSRERDEVVEQLAILLSNGVPGSESVVVEGQTLEVEAVDIVNATWRSFQLSTTMPTNRLALKALDTLDFLQKWRRAGGETDLQFSPHERSPNGALTAFELNRRLQTSQEDKLTITPLLPGAVSGASVDLRLGNKFIVFEKTNSAAFDALEASEDPRSFQTAVEKSWGDVFYLHPGQLVLAATLEYIVMPGDLTAQVITRSSYGRLGLLSATAVQVHPYFSGCLTLELVNLGEMPMAITPGERVAQLMMWTTTGAPPKPLPLATDDNKYRFPTGPEFSKIRDDAESQALRTLRRQFKSPGTQGDLEV